MECAGWHPAITGKSRLGLVSNPSRILVVDDDAGIREPLRDHIQRNGYECIDAPDAGAARHLLQTERIDLVILDIMMPGEDGLSLCRFIRETMSTPIILLTAMADDTDRIIGLEIGADDYVTKPFNPRELLARIKAVLRRSGGSGNDNAPDRVRYLGEWRVDKIQSELHHKNGLIVQLSANEMALLTVFLDHSDEVLSRDALMEKTRGREQLPFERSIDNLISRLRQKIEKDPKNPRLIKTVWGGGYRLAAEANTH